MPERNAFEYALLRVIPRIERGECLNAGVLLICRPRRFLGARVALDPARLLSLAPYLESSTVAAIEAQIALVPRICGGDAESGPIAALSQSERWHWLTAPASTIVQPGPIHTGLCDDPAEMLEHLFASVVALPAGEA